MKAHFIYHLLAASMLGALALPSLTATETTAAADNRPVLGIRQKQAIKVVFQITAGDDSGEPHKDLSALNGVYKGYIKEGVAPEEISIHAVIHGDAADHLLSDEAWNKRKDTSSGNPSTGLIESLVKQGVRLELCDSRRVRNGWEKSEIHPGVALVSNAYHRLADLQLQGYAYVRQ